MHQVYYRGLPEMLQKSEIYNLICLMPLSVNFHLIVTPSLLVLLFFVPSPIFQSILNFVFAAHDKDRIVQKVNAL